MIDVTLSGPVRPLDPDRRGVDGPVVVVGVDGTARSTAALRWADEQAQVLDAQLVALTAYGTGLTDQAGEVDPARAAAQAVQRCVDAALPRERALRAVCWIDPDEPVTALCRRRDWHETLVVVGGHHRNPLRPLGAVTEHVVAHAPAAVAVVRQPPAPLVAGQVVVGVDGSPFARPALRWAARYAERVGARVLAVLAWTGPPDRRDLSSGSFEVQQERILHDELAREVSIQADGIEGIVRHGDAVRVLREVAAEADLLVVGRHGGGAASGRRLGSVAHHLVRSGDVPVVVVPPNATQ